MEPGILQHAIETTVTFKDLLPLVIAGGFSTGLFGLLRYIDHRLHMSRHEEFLYQKNQRIDIESSHRHQRPGKILSRPTN